MDYHDFAWVKEFPAAITVTDAQGIVLEMNDRAAAVFVDDGGLELIGKNVLDCHPEPARRKLEGLMERREKNVYTIEKNGVHKLIFQTPWYLDDKFAGFIEMAFEIPAEMPHFIRS